MSLSSSSSLSEEERELDDYPLRISIARARLYRMADMEVIQQYLQVAMSQLDHYSIMYILEKRPTIITTRDKVNQNLPIHDIVGRYFDVKGALDEDDANSRNTLLNERISSVQHILRLFIEYGIEHNVGCGPSGVGGGSSGAGGLFELNEEPIDFVTKRKRTPLQILLSKFELILSHCTKFTFDDDEREERESLLNNAKGCIQLCIDAAAKAWKAQGCKDTFTIMSVAIEVFPLLKLETMNYILCNFDQVVINSTTTANVKKTYPLQNKDTQGKTVLIKAIYQATKRKQWGDWKSRFQAILFDKNNDKRQEQCWIRDNEGRLPIHIAIEQSLAWNNGLKELAEIDSSTLLEADPINGLQPFAYIASKETSSSPQLSLIMNLILSNPAVIQSVPLTRQRGRSKHSAHPVRRSKRLAKTPHRNPNSVRRRKHLAKTPNHYPYPMRRSKYLTKNLDPYPYSVRRSKRLFKKCS